MFFHAAFTPLERNVFPLAQTVIEGEGTTMENADLPFAAVFGGLWQLDETRAAAAKAAAKIIGAEFAKAGFGLVVYFSDQGALEPMWSQRFLNSNHIGRRP